VLKDAGCGQGAMGEDHPEPSTTNPLPGILGGVSSSSYEAGDARCGGAHPPDDAEAGGASSHRPMDVEVLEVSEDEADLQLPAMFHCVSFRPLLHRRAGATDAEAGMYQLHLSKLFLFFVVCLQVLFFRGGDQCHCEPRGTCLWREHWSCQAGVASALSSRWCDSPTYRSYIGTLTLCWRLLVNRKYKKNPKSKPTSPTTFPHVP
jgi:hypothetical protein